MKQNKSHLLWRELLNLGRPFSKVDIRAIGKQIYYLSDERIVRKWVEKGFVIALDDDQKKALNLSQKIAWYKIK